MRIVYLFLLIAAVIFYLLFSGDISFYLLCTLILLPLLLGVLLLLCSKKITVSFECGKTVYEKGDTARIKAVIKNDFPLPVSRVKITLKAEYSMGGEDYTIELKAPAAAKGTAVVYCEIASAHCGKVNVTPISVRVYDLLGLGARSVPADTGGYTLLFIPPRPDEDSPLPAVDVINLSSVQNAKISAGGDNIYGFREFAQGDKISMIHYKLSSRFDKDYVRIMCGDDNDKLLIIPDFDAVFSDKDNMPRLDAYDEVIAGCGHSAERLCRERKGAGGVYIFLKERPQNADVRVEELPDGYACEAVGYESVCVMLAFSGTENGG
ncbi:MAG: DUF58 domain-containing protein [Oscillospiraceae bacterium]|nr:DUF58 domain-containing protein [Oscillospiraceae bacterium]